MIQCNVCEIVKGNADALKVYEDEIAIAILHPKPTSRGHVILFPKKHVPIIENLEDDLIGKLFNIASMISSSIFESLEVHGTNIFVQNGIPAGQMQPHVVIHIIPRMENDGIDLTWNPKKVAEEELQEIEKKLKEDLNATPEQKIISEKPKAVEVSDSMSKDDDEKLDVPPVQEDNYLLKQLKRIP